jgi:phospholipid/cholesterol/gamma-HCH transport system substrate-binding protein
MKKDKGLKWKLGIFVTGALVLLVAGLFFIGSRKNLFTPVFNLKAVFNNVSGLKVGNNVRFGGITIGTVNGISLITDTSVMVDMVIREDVHKFIKRDATAGIGSDGLMGDRVVLISPGTNSPEMIRANEILITRAPVETEQILAGLKTSADNAAIITQQLSEIAYKVNHGKGVIARLLGDSTISNNFNATLTNLKKGSAGLSENMEAAKHNFLLRGYFKKKKKMEDKKKEEAEKAQKESTTEK